MLLGLNHQIYYQLKIVILLNFKAITIAKFKFSLLHQPLVNLIIYFEILQLFLDLNWQENLRLIKGLEVSIQYFLKIPIILRTILKIFVQILIL